MKIVPAMKRMLPAPLFHLVRDLPYILRDSGPPPGLGHPVPRLRDQYDGPRGYNVFLQNGREALDFYRQVVGLEPGSKMLDIGSGIGRKTLPLLDYFNADGLYVGIDIDERGITWCSNNISPINQRFVFFRLNVFNKFYNPAGKLRPDEVVLPLTDSGFDLVALWSVFTHMYAADIARYLSEISRVLKPGGRVASSYYILNAVARSQISNKTAIWDIIHPLSDGKSWTNNPNIPEDLIAVDESWLRNAYESVGLRIVDPIMFGSWSGRSVDKQFDNLNVQDIVIAEKFG